MTIFTHVRTRDEFNLVLKYLKQAKMIVVDTETNGLLWFGQHFIISLSIYFPEVDHVFNLAFRHGEGRVDVDYNETHSEGMLFADMNWQGKAKKQLYLEYWFQKYAKEHDFGNLPIAWMDELKADWHTPAHLYHNAKFDLHMLHKAGFPTPETVYDTMVQLHIVQEDWTGIEIDAPFQWSDSDRTKGNCSKSVVGQWAKIPNSDELMKKKQNGNRQLKWQCAAFGIPDATKGEETLYAAIRKLEENLTDYIMDNLHDPYNDSLVYASISKAHKEYKANPTQKSLLKYQKAWEQYGEQQRARIREKIELDDKAHLWMLPAEDVAYYAMLDVVLTYRLHEYWMPTVRAWNNVSLYHKTCQLTLLAWQMERNGVMLDVNAARDEIKRLDPLVEAVEHSINGIAHSIGYGQDVNPSSPKQLIAFMNWENPDGKSVLELPFDASVFPDSYQNDERVNGLTYYDDARPTSSSHDVLQNYDGHPFVMLVLEHRKLKKSSDTYLKNWLKAVRPNGHIHFGMNETGTVAGRWSSSGYTGNGQNIPDRNGYTIKRALIVPPKWLFVGFDYGQLEARIASWYAEDLMVKWGVHNLEPQMLRLFNEGVDMHAFTRDEIDVRNVVFPNMSDREVVIYLGYKISEIQKSADKEGITLDESIHKQVMSTCRYIAKTLNFGLLYSGTEYMASKLLRVDLDVARVLVARWRALFPAFAIAQEYYTQQATTWRNLPNGKGMGMYATQEISGRHRKIHKYPKWIWYYEGAVRKGFNPQKAASEKVWNNQVQGLGGYICTVSGLEIVQTLGDEHLRFFANIHDALDGYIHVDHLELVKPAMQIMTNWDVNPILTVDLAASVDGTWQNMKSVKNIDLWIDSKGSEGYKK